MAKTDNVTLIRDAIQTELTDSAPVGDAEAQRHLLANTRTDDRPFRCTWAYPTEGEEGLYVAREVKAALGLQVGDAVWTVAS